MVAHCKVLVGCGDYLGVVAHCKVLGGCGDYLGAVAHCKVLVGCGDYQGVIEHSVGMSSWVCVDLMGVVGLFNGGCGGFRKDVVTQCGM